MPKKDSDNPLDKYNHLTKLKVRFNDTDLFGHTNHASYYSYMEEGRHQYFKDVFGLDVDSDKKNSIILVSLQANHKIPTWPGDELSVYTRCKEIGNKSLKLEYFITKDEDGLESIVLEGSTVMVTFNHISQKSRKVPKEWRDKIKKYDGVE